jgi:predicted transposase YbfD/YdcC
LHWVRDNTFSEDACQVKSGNAPQTLGALRNLAISLLHRGKSKNIAAALRSHALNPKKTFVALGVNDVT